MEEGSEVGRAEGVCLCTLEAQPRFPETLEAWPHAAVTSLPHLHVEGQAKPSP